MSSLTRSEKQMLATALANLPAFKDTTFAPSSSQDSEDESYLTYHALRRFDETKED